MNILITAANSAPAYRLKNQFAPDNVIMGDYLDLPDFMLRPGKLIRLPDPQSASYTHEMLTLCLDLGIETVYLLRAQEFELIKQSEILFNEYQIKIVSGVNEI